MNTCNKIVSQGGRVSRINNLVTRMLANREASSSSVHSNSSRSSSQVNQDLNLLLLNNEENNTQQQQQNVVNNNINTEPINPSLRRNLFGIRMNHDQLKQDLNSIWKEQLEAKKNRWNFDFEKLKPVNNAALDQENKVQWKKVNIVYRNSESSAEDLEKTGLSESALLKEELNNVNKMNLFKPIQNINLVKRIEEELQVEEEQVDSLPHFYQYQRRFKLHENKNRINLLNQIKTTPIKNLDIQSMLINAACLDQVDISTQTSLKDESDQISKDLATKSTQTQQKTLRKPKPVKRVNELNNLNQVQIITFSENRKDTLRSAQSSAQQTRSAFKQQSTDNFKQQSLLEMFKQRKRRLNFDTANSSKSNDNAGHYLRSHSAAAPSQR
jgi:hypothetical protein